MIEPWGHIGGNTMSDPLDKAGSRAPAVLGEGCLARYDPDELTDANGTEFEGAQALWRALQRQGEIIESGLPDPHEPEQ